MKPVIKLYGKDYEMETALIEETVEQGAVYVLDNKDIELHQYITNLSGRYNLDGGILHRLRVCRERDLGENVSYYFIKSTQLEATDAAEKESEQKRFKRPHTMSNLLELLDREEACRIVIENNSRVLLADVIQQLIYIDYPLTKVDVKLRKEFKDAVKANAFMKQVDELAKAAESAVLELEKISVDETAPNKEDLGKLKNDACNAYWEIKKQIEKARDVEIKVAVAASKKTGKSTIVNSMLRMQLAPTSLQLATPNSCIYRKSQDSKFHLHFKGKTLDFDDPARLYRMVDDEFQKAQADSENSYTIEDMKIDYVSKNGNNFDSYTIYDTPGPDLAGSGHAHAAQEAIEACDVAIFAIDYTKFLTTTEVDYLKDIKSIFDEKQKFHSLLFVINKMDQALQNPDSRSRVEAIDFIRCRLRELDHNYGDCIIFATAAQSYFYTVQMQNATEQIPELKPLLKPNAKWDEELPKVIKKPAIKQDKDLRTALTNLRALSNLLMDLLDYESVCMEDIHQFSGMPQLLGYAAYIAKSKAREEIVNSITFTIDSQYKKLQAFLDKSKNIAEMMTKNKDEIVRIDDILKKYRKSVHDVLRANEVTLQDATQAMNQNGDLKAAFEDYRENETPPLSFLKLLMSENKRLKECREYEVQRQVWDRFKSEQEKRLKNKRGEIVSGAEELLLPKNNQQDILLQYSRTEIEKRKKWAMRCVEGLNSDLVDIFSYRLKLVNSKTEECKKNLAKEDCYLSFPEPPSFDITFPTLKESEINVKLDMNLSSSLECLLKQSNAFVKFIRGLFNSGDTEKVSDFSEQEMIRAIDGLHGGFCESLNQSKLYEAIVDNYEEIAKKALESQEKSINHFSASTTEFNAIIQEFTGVIDDTEVYQKKVEDLLRENEIVDKIKESSNEFMKIWESILQQAEK